MHSVLVRWPCVLRLPWGVCLYSDELYGRRLLPSLHRRPSRFTPIMPLLLQIWGSFTSSDDKCVCGIAYWRVSSHRELAGWFGAVPYQTAWHAFNKKTRRNCCKVQKWWHKLVLIVFLWACCSDAIMSNARTAIFEVSGYKRTMAIQLPCYHPFRNDWEQLCHNHP